MHFSIPEQRGEQEEEERGKHIHTRREPQQHLRRISKHTKRGLAGKRAHKTSYIQYSHQDGST